MVKKSDEIVDKKGESMADWGRRTIVTLALTFLTSSQGLLIAASKSKHVKYDYSVTSANCTARSSAPPGAASALGKHNCSPRRMFRVFLEWVFGNAVCRAE